jgi:hypothetical protein
MSYFEVQATCPSYEKKSYWMCLQEKIESEIMHSAGF